jgi:hypothetical protein
MDRTTLEELLTRVDERLCEPVVLVIYGAAAFMLLGEEGRASLDVDVAGPYCQGDLAAVRRAFHDAGVAVNPPPDAQDDHVEWVGPERLSLAPPGEGKLLLWQGRHVRVETVAPADLVASKLIRYDETDQADIRSLCFRMGISWASVQEAVTRLPDPFRRDALVLDNLNKLKRDMALWTEPS